MSQALKHFRDAGLAQLPDEDELDHIEEGRYQREPQPLYPAYGGSAYPLPQVTTGGWNR